MKLYWSVERAGNGWNDWWNSTCPGCGKKFEKRDPSRFCPECGTRTHGCKEEYTILAHDEKGAPVRKQVQQILEFDRDGKLVEFSRTEKELEVPNNDPEKVFHRRYNMV